MIPPQRIQPATEGGDARADGIELDHVRMLATKGREF
jgi:hypothetical protein